MRTKWATYVTVALMFAAVATRGESLSAAELEIVVAPHTINLQTDDAWVTVHVNIAYVLVDRSSLTLNGLIVSWTKADDCGDLVAKFNADDMEAMLKPGTVTLTLDGMTISGDTFWGSDSVRVIDKGGK